MRILLAATERDGYLYMDLRLASLGFNQFFLKSYISQDCDLVSFFIILRRYCKTLTRIF